MLLNKVFEKLTRRYVRCLQSMDISYIPGKQESDDSVKEEKKIVGRYFLILCAVTL